MSQQLSGRMGGRGRGYYPQQPGRGQAWQPQPPMPPQNRMPPTQQPMPSAGRGPSPGRGNQGYPQQPYPAYNPYATYNPYYAPPPTTGQMRGGVFYPPPPPPPPAGAATTPAAATIPTHGGASAMATATTSLSNVPSLHSQTAPNGTQPMNGAQRPIVQPPPRREKKPLLITDKHGNVIDLSKKKETPSTTPAAASNTASAAAPTTAPTTISSTPVTIAPAPAVSDSLPAQETAAKTQETKVQEPVVKKPEQVVVDTKSSSEVAVAASKPATAEPSSLVQAAAAAAAETEPPKKTALQVLLQKPEVSTPAAEKRLVYTREKLLGFQKHPLAQARPASLPDLTITKGPARQNKGKGGKDDWQRQRNAKGGEWSRGQAQPKQQNSRQGSQGGGGGGNRRGGQQQQPLFDGPVAPLVKSENHWRPKKNSSPMVVAEKQVKSLLNKMTKEKFERLSQQMVDIPIVSYDMLVMMIENLYDKAIDEPSFGDMYADLCNRLSQAVVGNNFVTVVNSDEEPPTDSGNGAESTGESSSYTVYRWSNDVSTTDSEIIGPFESAEKCTEVALEDPDGIEPVERNDMALEVVSASIRNGTFIKIMKKKDVKDEDNGLIFYTVYFPVAEAEECGQQLSGIFLSKIECENDAQKKNSFKRCLLNKCEEEFNKQDIYVDWKREKAEYEDKKASLSDAERNEQEAELDFRRIRIKKQMLGNIKFIGQLYKKGLLKEKIMRYCIASLLKLKELKDQKAKNPEYEDSGDRDMDEEDHEAICSMFATIGSTIDKQAAANFMSVCFTKIASLSTDQVLPSRSRFMYKDLLELRENRWVPRRKVEKAKTLEEIRKEVELEERKQAQLSANANRRGGNTRPDTRVNRDSGRQPSFARRQPAKPTIPETDSDGFTTIKSGSKTSLGLASKRNNSSKDLNSNTSNLVMTKKSSFAALEIDDAAPEKRSPLSEEQLKRRIKSMRSDFIADGGNVEELMLSFDEISGTENAGAIFVQQSCDELMECKDVERNAILQIIAILVDNKKLSPVDVKDGLLEVIEFIDSVLVDAPKGHVYLGALLGDLLQRKIIDIDWFCEQVEKPKQQDSSIPEKLTRATIMSFKSVAGADAAKELCSQGQGALKALCGDDVYSKIVREL